MRQAGRYHSHYQALRKQHSFVEICKIPSVAAEATMGPIRDFDFDAAILFSDLLFPLESMGMGLRYEVGPELDWHLREKSDLKRLGSGAELAESLRFQGDALELIRKALPPEKGLLGFVGGPLTLFFYAVEGSHQGDLGAAREGMQSGLYEGFCDRLRELLAANMAIQHRAGADCVALLDTCGGEVPLETYRSQVVPELRRVLKEFRVLCPGAPVAYYSKGTGPAYWDILKDLDIQYLGVDWNHDLSEVLARYSDRWAIQGNIDPNWMLEPWDKIEGRIRAIFEKVRKLPSSARQGWVCGLGHGILPKTPEANVRNFLKLQKEIFG
jgi:uroporphyrinogen decarboxylase